MSFRSRCIVDARWCGTYLSQIGSIRKGMVKVKKTCRWMLIAASLMVVSVSAVAQGGADTYKAKCAMCHAADGTGSSPAGKSMKTPSFLASDVVSKSDGDMIALTKSGVGKMPAYAGKLSDGQIKDVVSYIRTLQKK